MGRVKKSDDFIKQVETEPIETFEAFKDDIDVMLDTINNVLGSDHLKKYPNLNNTLNHLITTIENMDSEIEEEEEEWEEEEEEYDPIIE